MIRHIQGSSHLAHHASRTGPAALFALAILHCALFLLHGCSSRKARPGESVLRYPIIQTPGTFDPARIQDVYTSELLQNVFEGLVTFDENNRIVGALADRWDVTADRRVWTFHLRQNSRFHAPFSRTISAEDVKYSLERSLWPETRSPTAEAYLAGIVGMREVLSGKRRDLAGVTAPDSHTVRIEVERPMGYFLGALSYPTGWIVCREAIEKNGGSLDEKAAIGTGPFRLTEYRHKARAILEANPEYYGGRPSIDRIERPTVLDFNTAHTMYEAGELDACATALTDFVADQKTPLKAESLLLPQANLFYLVMHPRLQPAFRDSRVRRAFAHAIDRDELVRVAYQNTSERADTIVPPGVPGSDPNPPSIPYDPARARALLAEAGYPGGRGFPNLTLIILEKQPEWNAMAQVMRDCLKRNLGITIALQEYEAATFWQDTSDQEKLPFYITGWIADYLDPQDFLSTLFHSKSRLNHVGYRNARFDSLCDRADAETDMAKRIPLYREAERILLQDMAVIPLVFYRQTMLVKPYVKDARHNLSLFFLPHTTTRIQR